MRLRKINNIIHRDLGFFVVGTTILYAISGLALNHLDCWDPNFIVHLKEIQLELPLTPDKITPELVKKALQPFDEHKNYRGHACPTKKQLKIYLEEGAVVVNLENGQAVHETVQRRPLFFQINCLHLNPKTWWRAFSDFFAISWIVVAITGLFVIKGRKSITGRGALWVIAGIIIPLLFLLGI